ncbi:Lrp/AsnC family transcriptional regulator [Candidatus Woesearchaeota archaeon]|nr:Lrp/AsnC family transcriptional regulator [Candidatus Woesearchaeota archaeon]
MKNILTTISKKDYVLLTALRANARQTLTQISKQTRIPISTLHERLKLQEKDMIQRFAALIDFSKLGFHTKVQLQLKCNVTDKERLRSFLKAHQHVNSIYKIAHEYDFFVEAVFEHIADVENFIENLQQEFAIVDYSAHYITKDIKREGFLANS